MFEHDVLAPTGSPPALVLRGPYDIPTSGAAMTVRIHVHLLRNSDGTSGMPGLRVNAVLRRLRDDLGARSITLVEAGRSTINNTAWTNDPREHFAEITATNPHADRIDVYLVGLPPAPCTPPPPRVFGRAAGVPASAMVFAYCKQGDEPQPFGDGLGMEDDVNMGIATHEMGHVLGLFHTYHASQEGATIPFDPAPCPELVNGSNGHTCGDYVQDTPADPSDVNASPPGNYPPYGGWDSTPPPSCALIRGIPNTDVNGAPYYPSTSNFMTKFNAGCFESFTAGQGARMIAVTLLQNGAVVQEATVPASLLVPTGFTSAFIGATIRFGEGASLAVRGSLDASGTTITTPGTGWRGIYVPGGSLTLRDGTTLEKVRETQTGFVPQAPINAVLVANEGQLVIDGATIQNTGTGVGVLVSGKGSFAHISASSAQTRIQGTSHGAAVLATAGASVVIDGDDVQILNNAEGIVATGTGSSVLITGAFAQNNSGPAVRASGGGRVDILRYTGYTPPAVLNQPVRLDQNVGGLYATATGKTGGGAIYTGERVYECDPLGCADPSVGNHNFTNNDPSTSLGPAFDIRSRGGSVVLAQENFWGPAASTLDTTAVVRDRDTQSYIAYLPNRTTAAGLTNGPLASRGVSSGAHSSAAMLDAEGGEAYRVRDDVLALIGEAEARRQAGDSTAAGARILSAWALSDSDDDRTAIAEAAGRTLAVVEPPALVAWTDGAGAWGVRARAAGLIGQERCAEAMATAGTLAAETGTDQTALGHRARGLSLRVEAAVGAHDVAGAVSSLTDLSDIDPEGAAGLALSVAIAFPDAPLSFGRGAASGSATPAKTTPEASGLALSAGPNPSSGAIRVSLVLAEASEATVAVFDALGRQVAVLHEGAASSTVEASFDGRTLPAGNYVVRAVVRGMSGTSVLTRTITIAR